MTWKDDLNVFLMGHWDKMKEIQYKEKGTFGDAKKRISKHFKTEGYTFEPSVLMLCCKTFDEYLKLSRK